jgi:hypothetical protein
MADLSKLKRRSTLGAPPPLEEASRNLSAPEVAPVEAPVHVVARKLEPAVEQPRERSRIDGRSLRRTGRTLQLATRVSWEFDERLRRIAQRDDLKLVEVLERGLDAYEAARK